MDMAQSDPEPTRPTDPDLRWTDWALHTLRDVVEIDMRCKRLAERRQQAPWSRRHRLLDGHVASLLAMTVWVGEAAMKGIDGFASPPGLDPGTRGRGNQRAPIDLCAHMASASVAAEYYGRRQDAGDGFPGAWEKRAGA